MNIDFLKQAELPPVLLEISGEIQNAGGRCCLVGGWVRDALLGVHNKDYDVEVYHLTEKHLLEILERFGKPNAVGRSFGVILLRAHGIDFDFAFPRTEQKMGKGHKGFVVNTNPEMTFREASRRRDFTINAMGLFLPERELVDEHGGFEDLQNRVLRHVGPAFGEDPLRALRAVQFAARFELELEPETVKICGEQNLSELSADRFLEEFRKWLLKSGRPSIGLRVLWETNQQRFFPEIASAAQNENEFRMNVLDICAGRLNALPEYSCLPKGKAGGLLRSEEKSREEKEKRDFAWMLCALCVHVEEEGQVNSFLERFTQDQRLKEISLSLWRGLKSLEVFQLSEPSEGEIRRLAQICSLAELLPLYGSVMEAAGKSIQELVCLEKRARELDVYFRGEQPFLSGKLLMKAGVRPGPHMGELISACFESQLDGEVRSESEALKWLEKWKS
jgi:tRNA nucleotidyltransferase (CCA-adding enzyme)